MQNLNANPPDLWNIQRLFVHFDNRDGYVHISEDGDLTIDDTRDFKPDRTYKVVSDLFTQWELFQDLKIDNPDQWISSHFQDKHLHTDTIRKVYREVVQENLKRADHRFAAVAVSRGDYDWIHCDKDGKVTVESPSWLFRLFGENGLTVAIADLFDRIVRNQDNRSVRKSLYDHLVSKWGVPRVRHVLQRHAIDLQDSCETLRVRDIRKIYASFTQLTENNIREAYPDYKQHIQNPPDTYDQLNPEQKKIIIQAISPERKAIDLLILANRIEGVIVGHRFFFSIYWLFHSDVYEDTEIAQVFQEILENQDHPQPDLYYAEIWAELLVKKEGSQYLDQDLVGRLFPAPGGDYYKITKVTNRWGKFTLFLESIANPKKGLIVPCSTALSWSSSKNLSTVIQDLHYRAPGYLANTDYSAEMAFIKSHDEIGIFGHSLGSVFAKKTLCQHLNEHTDITDKTIQLIGFNSPMISREDARMIDEKRYLIPQSKIYDFFGFHDPVSFAGEEHPKADMAAFLSAKGKTTPELDVNPHCNYYFRNSKRLDNITIEKITPEQLKNFGKLHNPFLQGN